MARSMPALDSCKLPGEDKLQTWPWFLPLSKSKSFALCVHSTLITGWSSNPTPSIRTSFVSALVQRKCYKYQSASFRPVSRPCTSLPSLLLYLSTRKVDFANGRVRDMELHWPRHGPAKAILDHARQMHIRHVSKSSLVQKGHSAKARLEQPSQNQARPRVPSSNH